MVGFLLVQSAASSEPRVSIVMLLQQLMIARKPMQAAVWLHCWDNLKHLRVSPSPFSSSASLVPSPFASPASENNRSAKTARGQAEVARASDTTIVAGLPHLWGWCTYFSHAGQVDLTEDVSNYPQRHRAGQGGRQFTDSSVTVCFGTTNASSRASPQARRSALQDGAYQSEVVVLSLNTQSFTVLRPPRRGSLAESCTVTQPPQS
jgi:hypothetical protein